MPAPARTHRAGRSPGWVPFALIALVVIPAIGGTLRLVEVAGGPHVMPANPRISASPVPVVVHIVCALAYAVLGAFQFSAGLRRRWPAWHRKAGRLLVVLGLAVALSALWMTLFYPRQLEGGSWPTCSGSPSGRAWPAASSLASPRSARGDVAGHRAWMTRAYALALGAGTQAFTQGIGEPIFGTSPVAVGLLLGAGWVINLAVAEYAIRRPTIHRTRRVTATTWSSGRADPA